MQVAHSEDRLSDLRATLKKSWNTAHVAYDECGVSLSHVTHYKVIKINKDQV